MCTLGIAERGLNSQPLTTGAQARRHRLHELAGRLRQAVAEEDQAVGFLPLEHPRVALLALLSCCVSPSSTA